MESDQLLHFSPAPAHVEQFEKIVNIGIDSRLRAVTHSSFEVVGEGILARLQCRVHPEDMITILLRLEDKTYTNGDGSAAIDGPVYGLLDFFWYSALGMSEIDILEVSDEIGYERLWAQMVEAGLDFAYAVSYYDQIDDEWREDLLTPEFILSRWQKAREDEDNV